MKYRFAKLSLLLAFILITFTSCGDLFSSRNPAPQKVTVSGSLTLGDALPEEFCETGNTLFRTAFAGTNVSSLTFSVTAVSKDGYSSGTGTVSSDHTSFSIPELDVGREYTITVTAQNAETTVLKGSCTLTLTTTNGTGIIIEVAPLPAGKGSVSLPVSLGDVSVSFITYQLDSEQIETITNVSSTTYITIPDVESGKHNLDIRFYRTDSDGLRSADVLVYHKTEAINVLPNMTTDTWIRNTTYGDKHLVPKGKSFASCEAANYWDAGPATFVLNSKLSADFIINQIYVISNYEGEEETGSIWSPYKTLSKALEELVEYYPSRKDDDMPLTIWLEAGYSESLDRDINLTDTKVAIDVYDNYRDLDLYAASIDTNGYSFIVKEGSEASFKRLNFSNDGMDRPVRFISIEDNSSVSITGCAFDNGSLNIETDADVTLSSCNFARTSINTEGLITLSGKDNAFKESVITMNGKSCLKIEELPEDRMITTLDISGHSSDQPDFLIASGKFQADEAQKCFDFELGDYQAYPENGKVIEVPYGIYVNPYGQTTGEGTYRNPYINLNDAISSVNDFPADSVTIFIPNRTEDDSLADSFTITKSAAIKVYSDTPLTADTNPGSATIRPEPGYALTIQPENDTKPVTFAASGLIFDGKDIVESGCKGFITVGEGVKSATFTGCAFLTCVTDADSSAVVLKSDATFTGCEFINNRCSSGDELTGQAVTVYPGATVVLSGSTIFGEEDAIHIVSNPDESTYGKISLDSSFESVNDKIPLTFDDISLFTGDNAGNSPFASGSDLSNLTSFEITGVNGYILNDDGSIILLSIKGSGTFTLPSKFHDDILFDFLYVEDEENFQLYFEYSITDAEGIPLTVTDLQCSVMYCEESIPSSDTTWSLTDDRLILYKDFVIKVSFTQIMPAITIFFTYNGNLYSINLPMGF